MVAIKHMTKTWTVMAYKKTKKRKNNILNNGNMKDDVNMSKTWTLKHRMQDIKINIQKIS